MPPRPQGLHVGRKLFFVLVLAALVGFGWAMAEKKITPAELVARFSGKEKETEPSPPPSKRSSSETAKTPEKPVPPPKKPDPVQTPPRKAEVKEPVPALYSEEDASRLFTTVDELLRKGRFAEARDKLTSVNRTLLPGPSVQNFGGLLDRVVLLCRLMSETTPGATIEMPPLTRVRLASGGKLVLLKLTSDATRSYYKDIRGFQGSVSKADIAETERLSPEAGFAEVWSELKNQCGYKGIAAEMKVADGRLSFIFTDSPSRKTTGLQYFDMADFAARNGANRVILPLLEQALQRDPNLVQSVHEVKGERMVDVFLYFLSISSKQDAEYTLRQILIPRYSDTRAYREKVVKDAETRDAIAHVTRKKVEEAELVKAEPVRPPSVKGEKPAPETEPAPDPEPVRPEPEPEPERERATDDSPTAPTRLPTDAPPRARQLVAQGDKLFNEAHEHILKSTPTGNPSGWSGENKKALACLTQAFGECYYPAQEEFEKAGQASPQELNERANECQMRRAMCRKRSVSTR